MAAPQGWSKLYDNFPDHRKFLEAGPLAGWLYFCGQAYCSRQMTDGMIPKAVVPRLSAIPDHEVAVQALLSVGLWHDRGGCYEQHDYCTMQRTSREVEEARAKSRSRQAKFRRNALLTRYSRVSHTNNKEDCNALVTPLEKRENREELVTRYGPEPVHGVLFVDGRTPEGVQGEGELAETPPTAASPGADAPASHTSKPEDGPKEKPDVDANPSPEVVKILTDCWLAYAPLPSTAHTPSARKAINRTLRLLHTEDGLPWEKIEEIVTYAAKVWQPRGFCASPASLRQKTTAGDQHKWEAIMRQIGQNGRHGDSQSRQETAQERAERLESRYQAQRKVGNATERQP